MPSFSNHIIFNMAILTGFMIYLQDHPIVTVAQTFIICIGYFIGTVIITPDMDIKSEASNRCGVMCIPYRKMFKHRGISHHPIWGIFTRIGYAVVVVLIVSVIFGILTQDTWREASVFLYTYRTELLLFTGGLFFSNMFHVVLDKIA